MHINYKKLFHLVYLFIVIIILISVQAFYTNSNRLQAQHQYNTQQPEPGSYNDPLVTKSYVEHLFRFKQLVIPSGKVVNLNIGDLFIVRSGRVKFRSSKNKVLLNLTSGSEIHPDSFIPANNLIIVPETGDYKLEALSIAIILGCGIK